MQHATRRKGLKEVNNLAYVNKKTERRVLQKHKKTPWGAKLDINRNYHNETIK